MLRMVDQQLAAELQRVLAGGMGQFVHEAFEVDGVLVVVDAAPEPGRYGRVAHGVVDQQVRDGVAEHAFGPGRVEALEGRRVLAVLKPLRVDVGQDRLAGNPHVQPVQIALRVQRSGQLALGDRVVAPVQHVLLARPDQLDRRAGHLLGDQDGMADVVVAGRPPAEPAAQMQAVDLALRDRQACGGRCGGKGGLGVLGRGPDLAPVAGEQRRRVHRLHGDMVLIGIAVDRLDLLDARLGERRLDVAGLVADEGFRRVQTFLQGCRDLLARQAGIRAFVPLDRQGVERCFRPPPRIRHHGDGGVADRDDLA